MNVVGHDHEGTQNMVFEVSGLVLDGFGHVGKTAQNGLHPAGDPWRQMPVRNGQLPPGKPGDRADCHGGAK